MGSSPRHTWPGSMRRLKHLLLVCVRPSVSLGLSGQEAAESLRGWIHPRLPATRTGPNAEGARESLLSRWRRWQDTGRLPSSHTPLRRKGHLAVALPDTPRHSLLPSKARALTLTGSAGRQGNAGHGSGSQGPPGSTLGEETTVCSRVSLSCWEEPPVCLPPASSSGRAESPEQTLENLELTCLSQRPHLTALSAPGQPQAAGAHPAPGLLPCAQCGDLTQSPPGGRLPGMVLPPRDLPSPLCLQPLQTLGPSRGPRSKAQTSTRGRNHC